MHSARPTGWTGEIDPPAELAPHTHGRHGGSTAFGATPNPPGPAGGEPLPASTSEPAPWSIVPVDHDPLTDTDPTGGLSKFDLGMVPASVTPPRTWRHAAWFAVVSSAATLGGLMFATAALVGNSTSYQVIDLPNMPRGGEYPPLPSDPYVRTTEPDGPEDFLRDSAAPEPGSTLPPLGGERPGAAGDGPAAGHVPPAPVPPVPSHRPSPAPGDGVGDDGQAGDGQAGEDQPGDGGPGGGDPDGGPPSESAPPPSRPPTSEPPPLLAGLSKFPDQEAMRQRTANYFSAVSAGDLRAAYAMTTGELREEGFAAFAARYAGAASIRVLDSSTDWDSTITTLRITREDGTQLTQRRRLEFTSGDEPRIESDELVS